VIHIYAKIKNLQAQLALIAPTFIHVKGHQDTKSDQPPTIPESLNIDCNKQASALPDDQDTVLYQNNPQTPHSSPHLHIMNETIIWWTQHCLCNAATNLLYQHYIQEKFQWTNETASTVNWQIHAIAQQRLTQVEKWIISKFIHEWLPLQDRHHVSSSTTNHQCPSCCCSTKTVEHILQCQHPDQQAIWNELHKSVYKLHLQ